MRPTLTRMSSRRVLTSSGGYLKAMAQRGARDVAPSWRWSTTSSTLTTMPSMSWARSCRCSPWKVTNSSTAVMSSSTRTSSEVGRPQARRAAYASLWRSMSKPRRAPSPCTSMRSGREAVTFGSFWRSESGGGVARVGEGRLARLDEARVEVGEGRRREEDLAADLDELGHVVAAQARRDAADRAHVVGDVLSRAAVAAGEGAHEPALLVEQVDRETVDLELGEDSARPPRRRARPARPRPAAPRRRRRCRGSACARRGRPSRSPWRRRRRRRSGSGSRACAATGAPPRWR